MHGSAYLQQNPSSPWCHQLQTDEIQQTSSWFEWFIKETTLPKVAIVN